MSIKNYLDLNEEIPTDDTTIESEYVEYLDENSTEPNKAGIRTFNTRDEDVFLLPHKVVVEVRGSVRTAAGAVVPADTQVSLVNNGWSLFRSARYQLTNQTVEDISMHLLIASSILNVVSFSDNYSSSVAIKMLWLKDTKGGDAVSSEFIYHGRILDIANPNDNLVNVRSFLIDEVEEVVIAAQAADANEDAVRVSLTAVCNILGITPPAADANKTTMLVIVNGIIKGLQPMLQH